MPIANIGVKIDELCASLEQSLSELEPVDAHEDSLNVDVDIFRHDIIPEMESLKGVFDNAGNSVIAAASVYLKENVENLSEIPQDIKESLLQVFLLSGTDNSITQIASDIVSNAIEKCKSTGDFDEIKDIVSNMISEIKAGDFGKLFGEGCDSIISETSDILSAHLDALPADEKEKIITSPAGEGLFTFDRNDDGSINLESAKATSGMIYHEDGSITDRFGITFNGEVLPHISEEDSADAADEIKEFAILLNDLYKGQDGFAFLDEDDRNNLFDSIKLVAAGFEVPEHCQESLEKYGKALQYLYKVEILDKDKIADAVDKSMEKNASDKADNGTDSSSSGFQKATYEWENFDNSERSDRSDQSDTASSKGKTGSGDSFAKEKAAESAAAETHGRSIIWEKTGNEKIDRMIEKRNDYIKNDSLVPTYRYKLGYNYVNMKIIFSAKAKGIEINGKVPSVLDCIYSFRSFINTNLGEALTVAVFEGVCALFSMAVSPIKDKVSNDDPDAKKAAAQEAKIEQAKKLAVGKLESSVADMGKNISKILQKPEQDRTSREKQDLIRTSSAYYNAVKDIIKLYGTPSGTEVVKKCVARAFEGIFSNRGISAEGAARLALLLEGRSSFNIDGVKVTIEFKDLFSRDHADSDKDNMSDEDDQHKDMGSEDHDEGATKDDQTDDSADTEKDPEQDKESSTEKDSSDTNAESTENKNTEDNTDDFSKDSRTDKEPDSENVKTREKDSDTERHGTNADKAENSAESDKESIHVDSEKSEKTEKDEKTDSNTESKTAEKDDVTGENTESETAEKDDSKQEPVQEKQENSKKDNKESVEITSLSKEEKALKNQIEKILSSKKVSADSIKNNPDIKNTLTDIKNAGNKQNVSDSVAKVIASIQKDKGDNVDQAKLKTVCKGLENISKINGTAVKIKNIISKAADFYKQYNTIGIIDPSVRFQMALQEKFIDYMKSKIPLFQVKNELRNCLQKMDGINKEGSFLSIASNAVTNTIISFRNQLSAGEKAFVSRIDNIMNSIVSVSSIAKEKVCEAIENSGNIIKLLINEEGKDISLESFDVSLADKLDKENEKQEDNLANDTVSENVSTDDEEESENKASNDDREEPEDKASNDDREEAEDKTSNNDQEEPEDKASNDDREEPEDKASNDDREEPEDKASNDDREEPEDKASNDDREEPKHKASNDDREEPEDKTSNDDQEEPEDKASNDDREEPEDKTSNDDQEEPEDKASNDNREEPEDKASNDDREEPDDKVSNDDREELGDKISNENQGELENKVSSDSSDTVKIEEDDNRPVDHENSQTDIDSSRSELEQNLESGDNKPDDLNKFSDQSENDDIKQENDNFEKKNGGDIDSSLNNEQPVESHPVSATETDDDGDSDDNIDRHAVSEANEDLSATEDPLEAERVDDVQQPDMTDFSDTEITGSIDSKQTDGQSEESSSELENGDEAQEESDNIEINSSDSVERVESSATEPNSSQSDIDGISDAIVSYAEEPDFGFSDFLNSPITVNGEEMTVGEAYENVAISNEDLAEALTDAISSDASNILESNELMDAYSDLLSNLSDMCGSSFTEALCDLMDPFASVNDTVESAFNSIAEDLATPDYVLDSMPDFDILDLTQMEFDIMDSIDSDNIIADGVDAAMQDISQDNFDTKVDDGLDAALNLNTSEITNDSGANAMPDLSTDNNLQNVADNQQPDTSYMDSVSDDFNKPNSSDAAPVQDTGAENAVTNAAADFSADMAADAAADAALEYAALIL